MQTPESSEPAQDQELSAPAALCEALARSHNQRLFVPPALDAKILAAAREHLQTTAPARPAWQHLAPWAALAACLALIFTLSTSHKQAPATAQVTGDINGDGQVDILDALALAQQLESGIKPGRKQDINGDGVIDRRDAEAIAQKVVQLEKGGGV